MPRRNKPQPNRNPKHGRTTPIIQRETSKHRDAFYVWLDCDRGFAETMEALGVSKTTLTSWIKSFDWHNRADKIEKNAFEKAAEKIAKREANRITKMVDRHRKVGSNLVAFGGAYLSRQDKDGNVLGVDNGGQAIRAIEKGIDIERMAENLATEHHALTGADGGAIAFTLEDWKRQADDRIAEVTQQVADRTPKQLTNGDAEMVNGHTNGEASTDAGLIRALAQEIHPGDAMAVKARDRIIVIGCAGAGKTWLTGQLADVHKGHTIFHTDDFIKFGYKESLYELIEAMEGHTKYIVEGVQGPRLLRKLVEQGKPGPQLVFEVTRPLDQIQAVYAIRGMDQFEGALKQDRGNDTILGKYLGMPNDDPPQWFKVANHTED